MEITQHQADLCSRLADYRRILILYALSEKPHNVGELADRLHLAQPVISRQLKILREASIVQATRRGKAVYYAPVDARVMQALDLLRAVQTDHLKTEGSIASRATERPVI